MLFFQSINMRIKVMEDVLNKPTLWLILHTLNVRTLI